MLNNNVWIMHMPVFSPIDEQMEIIRQEQSGTEDQVKSYIDQINRIDDVLAKLQTHADNIEDENNVKKIQAMVGTR